ncbi:hypothetical protein GOV05_04465 [Candidatus Woesearchaeota archaeon]|nr:hypothetical protein [Candidatus Woesearchaeota archaeon]
MKILFFCDNHSDKKSIMRIVRKAKKADVLACLGDVSMFELGLDLILKDLDKAGKPVLMIHGNHEFDDELEKMCKKTKNVKFVHEKIKVIDGVTFFGYGGGGFSYEDPRFDEVAQKNLDKLLRAEKLVLLTHQPPFGTKIDLVNKKHVGSLTIKDFIINFKPRVAASGHLHENFDKQETEKDTLIINPGPDGVIIEV